MLFQKRQKTVPMQGMSKPSSQCEQSQQGEKQQGILSRVMSGGHNYSLLSNSKTSFPPIKHNPTVPPVCGMAGTETVPLLLAQRADHGSSHHKPASDTRQSFRHCSYDTESSQG